MPVQTIKTDNMRTAAVLMARGCEFHESRRSSSRPDRVEFTLLVADGQQEEMERAREACERRQLDIHVHLGDYERAFKRVRNIIEKERE